METAVPRQTPLRPALAVFAAVVLAGIPAALGAAEAPQWPFAVGAAQRPGVYWWCPGSAFTREDIDWNLERFAEAGFGFVHIIPIYGARGAESQYIPYLSPQWMKMLDYTVHKARSLGLFVDMTTGTGWCFGGPNLPVEAIDAKARYDKRSNTVALTPGMKVKRAAPGGEGPMINPFSPRSMALYLERFSKAFDESKAAVPRAQYHDSFEYKADWCPELLVEFKARRGYDLGKYLPVFFDPPAAADDDQLPARLKCDYRQTLAELHCEAIQLWSRWAHRRGMLTREEAHGSPANLLDVYAVSDIPETEMFGAPEFSIPGFRRDARWVRPGDSDPRICALASSAAHVAHPAGRQLVSSESCTWLRENWHESLEAIKPELDLLFLTGVNQMLFHGSCYSPKDAPWPGWFFYAATKMDSRNAIWRDVPQLTRYIGRCQSVLQAGQPANDVLLYWPIHDLWMNPAGTTMPLTVHHRDWMAKERFGEVADLLWSKGYAFDFVSDRMIEGLRFVNGKLTALGGAYHALVVPACKYMPEATLKRLADLAQRGAPIVFEQRPPADVPGLADLERRRKQAARDRARLEKWGAIVAEDAAAALMKAMCPREPMAEAGLRFIRRKAGSAWWYFIANQTERALDGWMSLGVPFSTAAIFEPMTGASGRLAARQIDSQVYLQLKPGETIFVRADTGAAKEPAWPYLRPCGEATVLGGEWPVEFIGGGPELPAPYKTRELRSWTSVPDARAQAFAGTARYTLRFSAPTGHADDWLLDLGDVRQSARVRLNGREAAVLVAIPFATRIGSQLKPGENTLEIEVTNLSANRIRDLEIRKVDWKIMKDANIASVNAARFDATQWPLEESGLLGPVRLIPEERFTPKP